MIEQFKKDIEEYLQNKPNEVFDNRFLDEILGFAAKKIYPTHEEGTIQYFMYTMGFPFDKAVDFAIEHSIEKFKRWSDIKYGKRYYMSDLTMSFAYALQAQHDKDSPEARITALFDAIENKYLHRTEEQIIFNALKRKGIVIHDNQNYNQVMEQHGMYQSGYDPFKVTKMKKMRASMFPSLDSLRDMHNKINK